MVNVSIFIEGGVLPNENVSVQTLDNSEKLRESFYSIFSQLLSPNKFNIRIKKGSSNKQTVRFFKKKIIEKKKSLLLIDLDGKKNEKNNRITDFDLTDYSENVFFMVQEMEAWIISQINKIDEHYKNRFIRKHEEIKLSEHEKIRNKHPEEITKPSTVLKEILGKYFKTKSNIKKKYGKLKDGADLLSILDAGKLKDTFADFNSAWD